MDYRDHRPSLNARLFELLQQDPERRVEGLDLAQVVRKIFSHNRDVR